MVRSFLTPGFRFHPTDVELVMYFLKRKVVGRSFPIEAISEIDLYEFDPWDLPGKSCLQSNDLEWYFFCPRARKYANGLKANRTTINGFWKATGEDKPVCYNLETVGWRKTLVFHKGKAPRGHRTDWVMHEYRLEVKDLVGARFSQDAYVVCKIFQKGGRGPRNGEQYGAPFNEEDYDDEVEGNPLVLFLLAHPSTSSAVPAADQNISMITSTTGAKEACGLSLEPVPLANLSSAVPAEDQNISMITNTTDPKEACNLSLEVVSRHNVDSDPGEEYFDINEMLLDLSNHDAAAALVSDGNGKDEEPDSCILPKSAIKDATGQDGCDIYEGLEDITPQVALEVDYGSFLELNDLTRIMEADGFEYNLSSDLFPFNGNNGSLEDFHGSPIPLDTVLPACEENWSRSIPLPDRSGFSGDQLAAVSEIGDFGGNSSWHCQAAPDSLSHSRKRRKK